MWKWIGGILLLVVICVIGASYVGYRKLTAGGDAATVTIAGSPERVFASLANHDSLSSWWVLKGQPGPTSRSSVTRWFHSAIRRRSSAQSPRR